MLCKVNKYDYRTINEIVLIKQFVEEIMQILRSVLTLSLIATQNSSNSGHYQVYLHDRNQP